MRKIVREKIGKGGAEIYDDICCKNKKKIFFYCDLNL